MKNIHLKNYLKYLIQLNAFLLLLLGSCKNSNIKKDLNNHIIDKKQAIPFEENISGNYYSDSMVEALSKPNESIEIDSFIDLHSFDKAKFKFENCNEFTPKMLVELDENGIYDGVIKTIKYPKVSKAQNRILGITEYLCDKTFSDDFAMYIFHLSSFESHYSNSIKLFTISNKSNKFNSLELAIQYLSEEYEYDLSSRFVSSNQVEVTKEERFNMSNFSSKDDSISITKKYYSITEDGEIKLIK